MKCGTRKVAPVFIDRDVPVEYELVRSICAVSQQKRKRLGVLTTDVQLYGGFNMQNMSSIPQWPIIDELEKQYEVVKVDPAKPITEKFDVLLAVQPSSLGPEEMDRFVAAVDGRPADGHFRGPLPDLRRQRAGHQRPRQPPGGMNPMMMRMPPPEKGDIGKLWKAAGRRRRARSNRLARLQPLSENPHLRQKPGIRVHRRRLRGQGTVQHDRSDHLRLAAGAVPVPGLYLEAERLESRLHAAGADGREDRHGRSTATSCRRRPSGRAAI